MEWVVLVQDMELYDCTWCSIAKDKLFDPFPAMSNLAFAIASVSKLSSYKMVRVNSLRIYEP